MLGLTMQEMLKPEIIWFLIGVVMAFCELFIPGLVIIFFAIGAIVTAASCMIFDVSINIQLAIFGVSSIASLILLRSMLKKIFVGQSVNKLSEMPTSTSEFVGSRAVVVEKIDTKSGGKIELNGSEWKAQSQEDIAAGVPVIVIGQDNLTMIVKPV